MSLEATLDADALRRNGRKISDSLEGAIRLAFGEVRTLFRSEGYQNEFGIVKLEEWPEGLVLWVGGEIRWASFRDSEFWNERSEPKQARK